MAFLSRGLVRLILPALLALAFPASPAAQADPAANRMTVAAVLCNDPDCTDLGDRLTGFTIIAVDPASGATLDTCVTEAGTQAQACVLEIPIGAEWELAWDAKAVPDGHIHAGYQLHVEDGPLGPITYVPFVPASAPAPTPLVIEEPGHVVVQAGLCSDASCREIERFLDLFIISAVDPATGEEFSSCATGNARQALDHRCILDVPHDGNFTLVWFADQVPDGYLPFGDPFPVGDPAVLTLGFYPATDSESEPTSPAAVTQLPSTGDAPGGHRKLLWHAVLPLASMVCALAGMAVMRGPVLASTPRRR